MKPETKLCVEFFKFRKYYAAHNSGLKIWLVSGIFEMAQLFNLKFCVYLCWLGAGFRHIFKPQNVGGNFDQRNRKNLKQLNK